MKNEILLAKIKNIFFFICNKLKILVLEKG